MVLVTITTRQCHKSSRLFLTLHGVKYNHTTFEDHLLQNPSHAHRFKEVIVDGVWNQWDNLKHKAELLWTCIHPTIQRKSLFRKTYFSCTKVNITANLSELVESDWIILTNSSWITCKQRSLKLCTKNYSLLCVIACCWRDNDTGNRH